MRKSAGKKIGTTPDLRAKLFYCIGLNNVTVQHHLKTLSSSSKKKLNKLLYKCIKLFLLPSLSPSRAPKPHDNHEREPLPFLFSNSWKNRKKKIVEKISEIITEKNCEKKYGKNF